MTHLVVNCRKVPMGSTLGVAHVLVQLCTALATDHRLTFVVDDFDDFEGSAFRDPVRAIADDIIGKDEADASADTVFRDAIELLPHHFQEPEFCPRSILICHDLHVFDIPWKYGDRAVSMQENLRKCLTKADAVMTHFPRTYYAVEQVAGITLMNLFLTESPLLLDTTTVLSHPRSEPSDDQGFRVLYPAQLQKHKNHAALIGAARDVRNRGVDVTVLCPGSDFDDSVTEELRSLVSAADLDDSFRFLGRVTDDELIALYAACDGVMVPSLAEGGAYVPLEAIAAGKPVAVHRTDAAAMHLEAAGAHVIWFDSAYPAETADALEELVRSDGDLWFDLNAGAREWIGQSSWDAVASKWNAVIAMLDGGRRPVLAVDRFAGDVRYL